MVRDIIGSDVDVRRAYTSPLISTATNLALCYGELGRWKEALSALRPAVTEASTAPFNIARLHLRSGKPRDAARYFVMAAELKPESEEALHGVGVAFMELRDWRNAEHYLHLMEAPLGK